MSRLGLFVPAAGATLALDLATKAWVEARLAVFESVPVIPGWFHLTHLRNRGVAFGLFSRGADWAPALLIGVTLAVMAVIVWMVRRTPAADRLAHLSLGLLGGGALGNLVDRVRYGEVVDFLDLFWGAHHWPAFNVADAAICLGVGGLLAQELLRHRRGQ